MCHFLRIPFKRCFTAFYITACLFSNFFPTETKPSFIFSAFIVNVCEASHKALLNSHALIRMNAMLTMAVANMIVSIPWELIIVNAQMDSNLLMSGDYICILYYTLKFSS